MTKGHGGYLKWIAGAIALGIMILAVIVGIRLAGADEIANSVNMEQISGAERIAGLERRVSLLEDSFDRSEPEITAETWAKAAQNRNGALEFAMYGSELRESEKKYLEAGGWITGGARPWIQGYKMGPKTLNEDGSYSIPVSLDWQDENGEVKEQKLAVILRKEPGRGWVIQALIAA